MQSSDYDVHILRLAALTTTFRGSSKLEAKRCHVTSAIQTKTRNRVNNPANDLAERQLGGTNMLLSRVGLGGWTWGGGDWAAGWGPQDDRDSIATIQRAVDAGVNWLDTAATYGLGRSEEVVGRVLRMLPAE